MILSPELPKVELPKAELPKALLKPWAELMPDPIAKAQERIL